MNYGLYLSAAGALTSMHRQDVIANNLANLNTIGFKPDSVDVRQRAPARIEDPATFADAQWMLERLGGGVLDAPTRVSLEQGPLEETGNDLDLAIQGDGLFAVSSGAGGPDAMRYTRDGRFTLNARGELVMAVNGMRVLDAANQPIRLDRSAPVRISDDGTIEQNGARVAQLHVIAPPNGNHLIKAGDNLLRLADGAQPNPAAARGAVRQGFTEGSAVDPILALNDMINASKSAMGNLRMMQYHDQLLGETFNTFGRVA
jgi:flagellar basal-body rod protein FlgF